MLEDCYELTCNFSAHSCFQQRCQAAFLVEGNLLWKGFPSVCAAGKSRVLRNTILFRALLSHHTRRITKREGLFVVCCLSVFTLQLKQQLSISFSWRYHGKSFDVWRFDHFTTNVLVKSKLHTSPHPPPGIPRAFDAFSCPGGRAFDHHSSGVENLIASLDFMLRVALISRRRRRQTLMDSKEKIVFSWRSGWKPKAHTSFVPYLKVFKDAL